MVLLGLALLLSVAGGLAAVIVLEAANTETEEQLLREHRARFDAVVFALEHTTTALKDLPFVGSDDTSALLIDHQGKVIQHTGSFPEDLARDPVVNDARHGRSIAWRVSDSNDQRAHYFAQSIQMREGGLPAVLIMAGDMKAIHTALGQRQQIVLLYLAFDILAVLIFGAYVSRRFIVSPLRELTLIAQNATGETPNPDAFRRIGGPAELRDVADAFATLVAHQEDRRMELAESLEKLERARAELVRTEKLAVVGRLSAGLAHEIGNPLAAVTGFLDYLRTTEDIPPELAQELLGRMDREITRINATIRQLLDFSRSSKIDTQPTPIRHVIEKTIELVRFHGHMKDVEFSVVGDPSPAMVDGNRMIQVLTNLFLNAGAAMDGSGSIEISLSDRPHWILVDVKDSGPGIPTEDHHRVFDPFWSSKPKGMGTGLGLWVSQRLVQEQGGELHLMDSTTGAHFQLLLPRSDSTTLLH